MSKRKLIVSWQTLPNIHVTVETFIEFEDDYPPESFTPQALDDILFDEAKDAVNALFVRGEWEPSDMEYSIG